MSMGSSGFAPPPLEELPIPKAEDAPVEVTPAQPVLQQPPGAGYAGRTGQVANIAANFLQGWLGGKAAKEIRDRAQALDEVKGTRAAVDVSVQTVHKLTNDGVPDTDPRMAQAKAALTSAWANYTGTMEKYAFPTDDKGKPIKQGVGSRLKGAVMGDIPHMMSQAAVDTLKKTNPLDLVPSQSPQERLANVQAGQAEKAAKERDQYGAALKTPEAQRTPEQTQFINYYEDAVLNRGPKERVLEGVFSKVEKKQPLSDEEKQLAGFQLDRPSVSVIQDAKTGAYNSVAIDKVGTVLSVKPLIGIDGKPIRGPIQDTGGAGLRNYRMMQQIQVENLKRAHPEWTDAQVFQAITGTIPNTAYADNAGEISPILKQIAGKNPQFANFVQVNSMTGDLVLRSAIPDAQKTHPIMFWKPNEFYGGATQEQLPALEDQFRSILKTELEKKFGTKYTPTQIQAMMGQPLTTPEAAPASATGVPSAPAPPPGVSSQGTVPQTLTPPPGSPTPGAQPTQLYTVTLANGQSQQMTLSAEQVKMIQAQDPSVKIAAAKQTASAKPKK